MCPCSSELCEPSIPSAPKSYSSICCFYQIPSLAATMSSRRTYSSSAPKYETQRPGRTYASPPPESYHGRQFKNAGAQEQYWNSRGSTEVWDPSKPLSSVAARPDTYGLAHSYHESTLETEYSDPYKKRPNPYTARTEADYDAYKRPRWPWWHSRGSTPLQGHPSREKDLPPTTIIVTAL